MSQIEIFNSGYAWNWLRTLNQFLDGFSWGAGLVLAFAIFVVFVNKSSKKDKP